MIKPILRLLAFITLLLILKLPSFAATVQFNGYVTSKGSSTSGELKAIDIGDTISGSLSYDTSVPDTNSWNVWGRYMYDSSNSSLSLTVRDMSDGSAEIFNGFLNEINVTNNWSYPGYPTIDGFNPHGEFSTNTEAIDFYIYFQNRYTGLDIFDSDELPNPLPSYDQFNFTQAVFDSRTVPFSRIELRITWSKTILDPVRIAGATPLYYPSLQDAYDNASDGDIIQCKDAVFTEDIYMDDSNNKSVAIQGGYDDNFSAIIGISSLDGNWIISNGIIEIENFLLQ